MLTNLLQDEKKAKEFWKSPIEFIRKEGKKARNKRDKIGRNKKRSSSYKIKRSF